MERAALELAHRQGRNLSATIDEQTLLLMPKVFQTGSLGWHGQGKLRIDDTYMQVSVICTVIGSKPGYVKKVYPGQGSPTEPMLPGEQNGTMPPNAPGSVPETSPLFPADTPPKKSAKRSKRS